MKLMKMLGWVIFWGCFLSIPLSFSMVCKVGEVEIFSAPGLVRYSWVMWLFIPIGVCSILIAVVLKSKNLGYKKNIISGCISITLLFLFGSYFLLFAHVVTYDEKPIIYLYSPIRISAVRNKFGNIHPTELGGVIHNIEEVYLK